MQWSLACKWRDLGVIWKRLTLIHNVVFLDCVSQLLYF